MGRSIAFDRHTVLNNALSLFWSRGFAATSLRQLEAVTELNPGSLYYHFTNKEQLFLATLQYYVDNPLKARISKNLSTGHPLDGIRRFLTSGYRHREEEHYKNCCFLASACTELPLLPETTRELISSGISMIRSGFQHQLERAGKSSLMTTTTHSAESLSQELSNLYLALQLLARANPNQKQLDDTVKQSLNYLLH